MRIKKEYIGSTIFTAGNKIYLSEVVSESVMARLKSDYPRYLEEEVKVKVKKKKTNPIIESEES